MYNRRLKFLRSKSSSIQYSMLFDVNPEFREYCRIKLARVADLIEITKSRMPSIN